jgi:hypothetical protein
VSCGGSGPGNSLTRIVTLSGSRGALQIVGQIWKPIDTKAAREQRGSEMEGKLIFLCDVQHTVPTLGPRQLCAAVYEPASVTCLCGAESGVCAAGPHSPWSPPFTPPTPRRLSPRRIAPQRIAPLCSSASQLLWPSATPRARASSATAPHLPDADHPSHSTLRPVTRYPSFRRDPFCA